MKQCFALLASLASIFTIFSPAAVLAHAEQVSANACFMMEAESGTVLFEKNADARLPMASTTKIMTGLLALESLSPDMIVTIPPAAVGIEGTSLYLQAGEQLTVSDLVYALLLRSANDAAVALALTISDSIPDFASEMNEKAEQLGLSDTHFTNPHGLPDPEHYTTARDLCRLASFAMQNPLFAEIVSSRQHRIVPVEGTVRIVTNHNKLLRMYPGTVGVKTGFTKTSGRCLVSAVEENGLLFLCVTLHAADDWNDHIRLYREKTPLLSRRLLYESGEYAVTIPVIGGQQSNVLLTNLSALSVIVPNGTAVQVTAEYNHFASAPIHLGQVLGTLICTTEDGVQTEVELCAAEEVSAEKKHWSFFPFKSF